MSFPLPPDEPVRLETLDRYDILDTPPEESFERITRLTRKLFDVPIVLITFVHDERQWFKSCYGLAVHETSRDISFCAHAILTTDVMVVEDAMQDPRFAANPLVTGEPGIRFYAGAPLTTPDGHQLGTLCIIDRQPRRLTADENALLSDLAAMVMDELELRWEVAERKRVEEALTASEAKFRSLVEQSSDWIWEVDRAARFVYASPGVDNLLGYPPETVQGKTMYHFMTDAEARRFADVLATFLADRAPFIMQEVNLLHRTGADVIAEVSGSPVFSADGRIVGYRGIAHDVTRHRQTEEALALSLDRAQEINELKSRFVSMASHEFRTPLAAIQISSEVLDRLIERQEAERAQQHTANIRTSVRRLRNLIDDILTLGRTDAGNFLYQPEPFDLVAFVREMCDDMQAGPGVHHSLCFEPPASPLTLHSDRRLLTLVLNNLLSNAIKYSPSGSIVTCTLTRRIDTVQVTVRDRGIGIPPADQDRLFEPFHRAENVGDVRGTGLGLAIVKQAVDLCGGTIAVDSAVGEGTVFTVRLPLTPDEVRNTDAND